MSRRRPLPSVAGMHHEPILYDLVRAHERDLRRAGDQHRLVRAVRPEGPTFLGYLRVATLAWLARGAGRAAPSDTTRGAGRTAAETTGGGRHTPAETTRGGRHTEAETSRGSAPTAPETGRDPAGRRRPPPAAAARWRPGPAPRTRRRSRPRARRRARSPRSSSPAPRHHRPCRRAARLASGRHRVERLARVRGGQHRGPAAQLVEQRGPGRPRRVRVVVEQVCERGIE